MLCVLGKPRRTIFFRIDILTRHGVWLRLSIACRLRHTPPNSCKFLLLSHGPGSPSKIPLPGLTTCTDETHTRFYKGIWVRNWSSLKCKENKSKSNWRRTNLKAPVRTGPVAPPFCCPVFSPVPVSDVGQFIGLSLPPTRILLGDTNSKKLLSKLGWPLNLRNY